MRQEPDPVLSQPGSLAETSAPSWQVGPITVRSWPVSPGMQGLIAFTVYAVFWVMNYVPALVLHPEVPQLDQSSMDPNFFVWSLRWWPYALSHGLDPLRTTLIGAPVGFNLSWLTTVPALAIVAAPLTALAGPITTFNLLIVVGPPLAGWAAFALCRQLTGRFWPSLTAGAIYAFSAAEMNHTVPGHLNITFSMLLPLLGYLVVLWRDGRLGRTAFISLFALVLLLQVFVFLETFAELTLLVVFALPIGYLLAGRRHRRSVLRLGRYIFLAYLAVGVVASPYLIYVLLHTPRGLARTNTEFNSLNLEGLVVPRPERTFGWPWLHALSQGELAISYSGYIGLPLLLIVIALAIWTWRRSKLTRFLVIMFLLILLLAVGPSVALGTLHRPGLPWAAFWNLPIAASAFPVRIMMLGDLVLAVVLALWLSAPLRLTALRWLLGILAVAAVILDIPNIVAPNPSPHSSPPAFFTTGEYKRYITPGETVVVLSHRGNAGMLFQAYTDFYFKLAGGFVNQAITPGSDLPTQIQDLATDTQAAREVALAYLRRGKVGAILAEDYFAPNDLIDSLRSMGLHGQVIGGITLFQLSGLATGHSGRKPSAA